MPISVVTVKGQTTIPKPIRERLRLQPKDKLLYLVEGSEVIVRAVHADIRNLKGVFRGAVKGPIDFKKLREKTKRVVASRVLKEFRELAVYGQEATPIFAPLSPREVEILDNIAQGMTNKQVAYALSISEQTVKNHMSSILRKLSVNDRTQAVVYAMRQGWIRMPED